MVPLKRNFSNSMPTKQENQRMAFEAFKSTVDAGFYICPGQWMPKNITLQHICSGDPSAGVPNS
jgi:hypothetical protein